MTEKPFVLMPEDIQRIMGKDAQRNNITAARMVSDIVKTTLGPKGMDKMLVSPTNDIINQYINKGGWTNDKFIISSFKWDELEKFRSINKTASIAILTEFDPIKAIPIAKKLDALAINPNYKSLNEDNINEIHANGFKIFPYTINEFSDIKRMIELGVDAIITDYPERVN